MMRDDVHSWHVTGVRFIHLPQLLALCNQLMTSGWEINYFSATKRTLAKFDEIHLSVSQLD